MFIIGQFWLLSSFYFRIQDDIATSSRNSDSHSDRKKENLINHALARVLPLCDMYHLTSHSTGQSGLKASHTMHWTGELWSPFPNCKDTICTILLMHNNTFHHQRIMEKNTTLSSIMYDILLFKLLLHETEIHSVKKLFFISLLFPQYLISASHSACIWKQFMEWIKHEHY